MSSTVGDRPDTSLEANPRSTTAWGPQGSFDELGRPLRDLTFTVVDLETTGGSAQGGSMITEIGAVKIRGGEVLGEFQTLVNPEITIPPFIAVLTGISDTMVADAPRIENVLPQFLEFAAGTILVAHNAPFDVGFLSHFALKQGLEWPAFEVLDTARLARKVITKEDAPNCKLSSLALLFGAETTPNHRALSDARATVDVLHGLIGRLGNVGVHTFEELQTFSGKVSAAQRRKRHLADDLPHAPGVYLFRDAHDQVLYVGTSGDLRSRVRTYFTASETRSRIGEMINIAERVEAITCATRLEAQIRELRLIAAHKPPYNRRSRHPERTHYAKLTTDIWPRLSIVRRVLDDGADYLGPYSSRRTAEGVVEALHEAFPLRQCKERLPLLPSRAQCVLGEMETCLAPCDGSASVQDYAQVVADVRTAMTTNADAVVTHFTTRMLLLAEQERFEQATVHRDRLATFIRGAAKTQRLSSLSRCAEIVAAQREADGRWVAHVIRHGRLAAAGALPRNGDAHQAIADLQALAESVTPGLGPAPAASAEESELLLRWLEEPGVRLVEITGEWSCPVQGAGRHVARHDVAEKSRHDLVPFDDRRPLAPLRRATVTS